MPADGTSDPAMLRDAFISYANQDSLIAEALCASLERRGISCWMAPRDVRPGALYADAIVRAITAAKVLVLVLSEHSVASPHVSKEIERASSKQRPIIALRTDAAALTPAMEYFLSESQWVDAAPSALDAAFDKVGEAIHPLLGTAAAAPAPSRTGPGSARVGADGATPAGRGAAFGARRFLPVGIGVAAFLALALFGARWLAPPAPIGPGVTAGEAAGGGGPPGAPPGAAGSAKKDPSVAVLPVEDLSEKKDQAYFSDGLSIELIGLLAKIPGLHVPARVSSFYFKGKQTTLQDIAHALNVSHVLEGTVSSSGRTLRITADLVSVDSGSPIWSETYDRKLDDVFKIQDDIADSVVRALKVALLAGAAPRASATTSPAAYTAFLKCQEASLFVNREMADNALRYCQEAVDLDPKFAPGWIELSHAVRRQFVAFSGAPYGEAGPRAHAAAERAIALDPNNPKAHFAMASILYQMDFDPAAADVEVQRAIALAPNSADLNWLYGYIADVQCRFEDALRAFANTLSVNPLYGDVYIQIGNVDYRSGQLDAAKIAYRRALELNEQTGSVHYRLGLVALLQGDAAAALAEFEREPDQEFRAVGLPMAYRALGRPADADRALVVAEQIAAQGAAYQIALIHAARKDADQTFAWLDRAYRQRDAGMLWIKGEPFLEGLRPDPRFHILLHEMHLD